MIKALLTFLFFLNAAVSFSQSPCVIKGANAFYFSSMPGMIRKDDKGNDLTPLPIVERFIYIECTGKEMPRIESVLYDDIKLVPSVKKTSGRVVAVGKRADTGKEITITARKGYTLWKIALEPTGENGGFKMDCKNINIINSIGTKACKYNLKKETALMTLPRY